MSNTPDWMPRAGKENPNSDGTSPLLFAVADDGSSALRIVPGLCVGESSEGELVFDAENSACRWLVFRSDDTGLLVEKAREGVDLTTVAGSLPDRKRLSAGLVLQFPNNRLLVSEDSLAHPIPDLVISVEAEPVESVDLGFLAPNAVTATDVTKVMPTDAGIAAAATIATESFVPEKAAPETVPPVSAREIRGESPLKPVVFFAVVLALIAGGSVWVMLDELNFWRTSPTHGAFDDVVIAELETPELSIPAVEDVQTLEVDSASTSAAVPSDVDQPPVQEGSVAVEPAAEPSESEVTTSAPVIAAEPEIAAEEDAQPEAAPSILQTWFSEVLEEPEPEPEPVPTPEEEVKTEPSTVVERISIAASMLFDLGSAELSDEAKAVLNTYIQQLADEARLSSIVRIEGHTDNTGAAEYNEYLSRLRAQNVADFIVSQTGVGLSPDIEVIGMGGSDPLASNDSREGRAQNRRVELFVSGETDF